MKEENNLLRKVGIKSPFRAPDGYFEEFAQDLMSKLPEKEYLPITDEPTLWQRIKPWLYMTAMFCGLMLSAKIFVGSPKQSEFPAINESMIENLSDEDWEIIIKRSMIDDYTLYQYLTENEENITLD